MNEISWQIIFAMVEVAKQAYELQQGIHRLVLVEFQLMELAKIFHN
jgi:hypothetical protein